MEDSEKAKLCESIVQAAQKTWANAGKSLLLSQLGLLLSKESPPLTQALGKRKLLEFIETELSKELRVVRHPSQPAIVGVLPAEAKVDAANAFTASSSRQSRQQATRTRFDHAVWAAFSFPLPTGMRRYVKSNPRTGFLDIPSVATPPEGGVEVSTELIVPRPPFADPEHLSKRAEKIEENILQWLRKNGIDVAHVTAEQSTPRTTVPVGSAETQSALDFFMQVLSETDLRRVHMPLDIVKKLRHFIVS